VPAGVVAKQGIPTQGRGEGTVQGRIKYCLQPTPLTGALFRPHQVLHTQLLLLLLLMFGVIFNCRRVDDRHGMTGWDDMA
jgi:hypothetical protein